MSTFVYKRDAVPVTQTIKLDVSFTDAAGNSRDTTSTPTIAITDAASSSVVAATSTNVIRLGPGDYRYEFTVPDGYTAGIWNDTWVGVMDGYSITNTFDFVVNSVGSVEAINSTAPEEVDLGDSVTIDWTKDEKTGINILLQQLKKVVKNDTIDADGNPCPVWSDTELIGFLCASLSEFNSTPTITDYKFSDAVVYSLASSIIVQGAYIVALAGSMVLEAGREFVLTDSGITINPPPVSNTMMQLYNAQLTDYRQRLKNFKQNLKPGPRGMGAGSLLVRSPQALRLRHRRENQII